MKKNFLNIKYIGLFALIAGLYSCNDVEDVLEDNNATVTVEELPALTAGSANFSTYVAVGNSLTAGLTDAALFVAGQENSIPNTLSAKFALAGGGSFTQPLMNDNIGGLAYGGTRLQEPRLVFDGSGPAALESVIGPVTVTTDLAVNNPTGPFNNMGVPGAKSFHLFYDGYGNPANLLLDTPTANPYFVRMASATNATVLGDAIAQAPTFFSLWIGNNDVLGYALSGGDGTNPITPLDGPVGVGFANTYGAIVATLTSQGAQGVVANIPDVTSIPHFTTVPYNALDPNDEDNGPALVAQIPTLNQVYGALNQIFSVLDPSRIITFSTTEANGVVIHDETLTDLSAQITGALSSDSNFSLYVQSLGLTAQQVPLVATLMGNAYGQARQANADDLFVLPSSTIIGEVNAASFTALKAYQLSDALAAQFSVEGITLPLSDKWVLLPSEQEEIATATANFNNVIDSVRQQAGLALVDANGILNELATTGITSGNYNLTSNLVVGGAFSLDGVHPTARGYAFLANAFMKAIDTTYGSNFEASGNLVNVGNYPTNYSPLLQ